MTLSMAPEGRKVNVIKVNGKEDIRRFLSNLGFVEGAAIHVITEMNGNMIVNIKDSRVAISKAMSNKIIVAEG